MSWENLNTKLVDDLTLKVISENDKNLISDLFQDEAIKKYYIVPKEARQDYKNLVNYWINDIKNGAGTCWIIYKKPYGIFSLDVACGFIAFEYRSTLQNARISYALNPNFRGQGIVSKAVGLVIENLKRNGVQRIEADIDRDNSKSERVVERFGFTVNKREALIDPEMFRDGEIRMRALWKKELIEINSSSTRIGLNASMQEIVSVINNVINEIYSNGQHPKLLIEYYYLLGRIKFLRNELDESKESFGHSNMIIHKEGLKENYENYYWFGRINEAKKEKENAKRYYGIALDKYYANPNLIEKEEILKAINELR